MIPTEINKKISNSLPMLSSQGRTVLQGILEDSSDMLQAGINQAANVNPSFKDDLKAFLLKRKKELIKDMEDKERINELKLKPNL